ncbi:hypothetical protein PLESTB_000009500 [Pleodorina starrii]|uniref:MaoC-like domain-containing protein n=1 Tax=Pleodorina starrii TaxID=330485 RepID=A0A9W6B846_9CHLO|nr:hypothetical protein PLESTM_000837700 [Pleodorina starrii]GLC47636.1 hypothetical protein PLESTB_000009500 [Pleodorina starrii]GLC75645.1 hypothetical protein PLESTF_001668600 [Pleodorina starrii]
MLLLQSLPLSTAAPVAALLLLVAASLAFLLLRPRGRSLVLSAWPAPAWLYIQALAAVTKRPSKQKGAPAGDKMIQVVLSRAVHFSAPRLRRYLSLADFTGGTAGDVPLMYPIVEAFRLVMQAMLLPAFPFNVLGSVLGGTRVVAMRRIGAEEKLQYSCRVDPAFRTTPKGHTEVDIAVEAHAVGPGAGAPAAGAEAAAGAAAGGSQLVWRSVTTVIILSQRRARREPPAAAAAGAEKAPAGPAAEGATAAEGESVSTKPTVIDTWQLGPDTGRRYGTLNGDLNPIHLYPATSALFGFKRPIAHALYLTGRAEASLRKAGLELRYPCALTAEFKRPTLLPATLHCAWLAGATGGAKGGAAALDSPTGARFAVLTSDLSKEVLVGSVSTAKAAVDKAMAA